MGYQVDQSRPDPVSTSPEATHSQAGMLKATAIYGGIDDQLEDNKSFVYMVKQIIGIRDKYGIATGSQLEGRCACLSSTCADDAHDVLQVTVINFRDNRLRRRLRRSISPGASWRNVARNDVKNRPSRTAGRCLSRLIHTRESLLY